MSTIIANSVGGVVLWDGRCECCELCKSGEAIQWGGAGLPPWPSRWLSSRKAFLQVLPPELKAKGRSGIPNCVKTLMSHETWRGSRTFLRLWIENVGNVRAEEVEVFLSRAWVEQKGSFKEFSPFTPMNLTWSYRDPKSRQYTSMESHPAWQVLRFWGSFDPAHPALKSLPQNLGKTRLNLVFIFLPAVIAAARENRSLSFLLCRKQLEARLVWKLLRCT